MPEVTQQLKVALADRYVIERELGAGGMATVYLAHDVKHERKVALKVLRPELAAVIGAERFLGEIKVTANLQHPHILPLHDSGEADSFLYYVMPYVEGETLREKIKREKQLSIEEAVELTRSVAAALDYAHRHEIVHRDIKPENILIHDGQPQVADFGIALAVSQAGGQRLTETGLSIGTPHYMSPEQAMGDRELDARSDVYSLGAMLYEMLTGEPPYTGPTAQAIVAKVITEKAPPVTAARPTTPPHVAASINKSLQKMPADRFTSAAAFAEALTNPAFTVPATVMSGAAIGEHRLLKRHSFANWQLVMVAIAAVTLSVLLGLRPGTPQAQSGPVARFTVSVGTGIIDFGSGVALAPDASELVYIGYGQDRGYQLYRRTLSETDAVSISGTESSLVGGHFMSPDGEFVAFYADRRLRAVSVSGGIPRNIVPISPNSGGGAWALDGTIIYQPRFGSGLMVVSAEGGEPRVLTTVDSAVGEIGHRWPHVLPDGKSVVFTAWTGSLASSWLAQVSLETGDVRRLIQGTSGRYVEGGYLVYATAEQTLRAARFDAEHGRVQGSPVTVLDSVRFGTSGSALYTLSENGTLVYVGSGSSSVPVIIDGGGSETPLPVEPGGFDGPRFSPDGQAVAVQYQNEIWIYDFNLGTFGPLTAGGGFYPVWTPDGKYIMFSRDEDNDVNIYRVPVDRAHEPAAILEGLGQQRTQDISPDGRHLMLRQNTDERGGQYDLFVLSLDGEATLQPWLESEFLERSPAFSPDGMWIAYSSDESGRDEVYAQPFPGPGGRIQVSTEGGTEPAWTPDGSQLLYRFGRQLVAVTVETGAAFRVLSRPRALLEGRYHTYPWQRQYDIHPDGDRFIVLRYDEAETELTVVVNWIDTVREQLEQ